MDASQRCIALLHGSEGFKTKLPDGRYKAYLDTLAKPAVPTIYCGLTKGVTLDTVWTVEQCERAFSKEMSVYEDAVESMVTVPLNQNQFDALVSFVYNVGPGDPGAKRKEDQKGFYWSTLRKVLNQGKYDQVPAQLMRYTHAGGVEYAGLVTRRKAEAALFMEPMGESPAPAPQESEAPETPPIPQRVEEKPAGTAAQAVKESWTIRGALIAGAGVVTDKAVAAYDWLFGVVKEAGPEVISLKTSIGPFDALLAAAKVSLPALLLALTIAGLAIVVMRRLHAAREGKVG